MPTIDGTNKPVEAAIGNGAAAAADIRIHGIPSNANLIAVHHITADLVTNADVSGEATVSGNGTIQLSTTDTSGDFVAAMWQMPE